MRGALQPMFWLGDALATSDQNLNRCHVSLHCFHDCADLKPGLCQTDCLDCLQHPRGIGLRAGKHFLRWIVGRQEEMVADRHDRGPDAGDALAYVEEVVTGEELLLDDVDREKDDVAHFFASSDLS